jgi:hypothetical protein
VEPLIPKRFPGVGRASLLSRSHNHLVLGGINIHAGAGVILTNTSAVTSRMPSCRCCESEQVSVSFLKDQVRRYACGACRFNFICPWRMRKSADGCASHILAGKVITGNSIEDKLRVPMLLYGIDFSSTGREIQSEETCFASRSPVRGIVVRLSGEAESNTIRKNSRR